MKWAEGDKRARRSRRPRPGVAGAVLTFGALAALAVLAARGQEAPAITPDAGTAAVFELPLAPQRIYLSPSTRWVVGERRDTHPVTRVERSSLVVFDLEQKAVVGQHEWPESAKVLVCTEAGLCAYFPVAQRLRLFALPDLTLRAEAPLVAENFRLYNVGDKFVAVDRVGCWSLPDLKFVEGSRSAVATSTLTADKPVPLQLGDRWFLNGFLYGDDLDRPLHFCGHPSLYPGTVMARNHPAPATMAGRRLSPLLSSLSFIPPVDTKRACAIELAAHRTIPASFDAFDEDGNLDLGRIRRVLRVQAVLPPPRLPAPPLSNRLLARINLEVPFISIQDYLNIKPPWTMATHGGTTVTAHQQHLMVFRFDEAAWNAIPGECYVESTAVPVVVKDGEVVRFTLRFNDGTVPVAVEVLQGNGLEAAGGGEVRFDPARVTHDRGFDVLFDTYWRLKRVSPRATLEQWVEQLREGMSEVIGGLERMSSRPLEGIPVGVPYHLKVVRGEVGAAELAGCLVVELSPQHLRRYFAEYQARRLAKLLPPPLELPANTEAVASAAGTDTSQSAVDHSDAASPAPVEGERPIQAASTTSLVLEFALNAVLSTLLGTLLFWTSCHLYRNNAPEDTRNALPGPTTIVAAMLVLSCLFAGWELYLVGWCRAAVDVDALPYMYVIPAVVLFAAACRGAVMVVAGKWLLHLPRGTVSEVLFLFLLMVGLPGTGLLSFYFLLTV